MIRYGSQDINQEDIDSVVEVLKSPFLTQGPVVPKFEEKVKNYTSAEHAVAVNSATAALHIAYLALGVGEGDEVWTSPISFVATSNAALYCGATVRFLDVEEDKPNLDIKNLEQKLKLARDQGWQLPKVVTVVHFSGSSCDMQHLARLRDEYGFKVIEDAAHAIGADFNGQKVGSCEYSNITVFSFHPVKIVTTAEGGMALTNDPDLYDKMVLLRNHGVTRNNHLYNNGNDDPWYYEQICLGFNYRMTDLQAALGVSQMERIESFISIRRNIASIYQREFSGLSLKRPVYDNDSSWHLYVINLDLSKNSRRDVYDQLIARGIGVNVHYIPIYKHPYYQDSGYSEDELRNAEKFYSSAITVPLHPSMTDADIEFVVNSVKDLVGT
jgi:UDP-4-amino-4,6-dideoxy-N-acetyl-beta-L-altrosamine transaminase